MSEYNFEENIDKIIKEARGRSKELVPELIVTKMLKSKANKKGDIDLEEKLNFNINRTLKLMETFEYFLSRLESLKEHISFEDMDKSLEEKLKTDHATLESFKEFIGE